MTDAYENSLRQARDYKARRTGTCRVCGAVTHYAGKPGKAVSELCRKHAAEERALRTRGSGELNRRLLRYLAKPRRLKDVAEHLGITHNQASVTMYRLMRYGLVERVDRGVYVKADA